LITIESIITVTRTGEKHVVNGKHHVPMGNPTSKIIAAWLAKDGNALTPEFTPQQAKENEVARIKQKANKEILAIVPITKQINMLTAICAMQQTFISASSTLTTEQQSLVDDSLAVWGQVKAIRDKSNEDEANL